MTPFNRHQLKQLYIPSATSHKGQNGKLLLIGGSHLFHASTLWALEIASKIVDMVFYASMPENNLIVQHAKEQFRNGIIIPQENIEHYIEEADCVLIGPGMVRDEKMRGEVKINASNIQSLAEILSLTDEGEQTYALTRYLLSKYREKKWVIDAGALQMLETTWLQALSGQVILTPHKREFFQVFNTDATEKTISAMAKKYHCIILVKGEEDIVCSSATCVSIPGGNAGMTKGGTGDVLAGLVAALSCKNDLFLSAIAGSYFNKKAGERMFTSVGYYFNSTDLVQELPKVIHEELAA